VLVVDDFEPFRCFVRSALRQRPQLEVIGELSDGLAAVQKAEELKPDLILLDIDLPTLNGLEAARQIRQLAPNAKIIFLTQESSDDVMHEALSLGARGYVLKIRAGSDLLTAVEAVLQGKRFVSGRVTDHDPGDLTDRSRPSEVRKSGAHSGLRKTKIPHCHEVQFYSDDESFLERFSCFIAAALKAGKAAIVLATAPHRVGLAQKLQAHGVDVAAALEQGRYVSLDAAEALSTFMVDGLPDPVRFVKYLDDAVTAAAKAAQCEHPRVVACGECAPLLLAEGRPEAAVLLERLTNELKRDDLDILCGYSLTSFQTDEDGQFFQRICSEHSVVHLEGPSN
jgi:CheY-like chemotaxis protein